MIVDGLGEMGQSFQNTRHVFPVMKSEIKTKERPEFDIVHTRLQLERR